MKMFNKISLTALTLMFLAVGVSQAKFIDVPAAKENALPSYDYGGVSYSTVSFSSAGVLVSDGPGSIVGFVTSSNSATTQASFIIFRDTDSLIGTAISGRTPGNAADDYLTTDEFARVYFTTQTAGGYPNGITYGQVFKFPAPIRFKRGCVAKSNTEVMQIITYLYTKFGETGQR